MSMTPDVPRWPTPLRWLLIFSTAANAICAVGFGLRWPVLLALWPLPGTTALSFALVSSIYAAAAASTAWVLYSGQRAAFAGIALDHLAIFAPLAVFFGMQAAASSDPRLVSISLSCVAGALFGLALFAWCTRLPLDCSVALPAPVRWSFAVFVALLLGVAAPLVGQVPDILPWAVTPQLSVVIGWMFFGAASYFAYGLLRPCWANAAGQLVGFLAYDVVLIGPLLERWPHALPQHRLGLVVYLVVVVYSALLAGYYLAVGPHTRLWAARGVAAT